MQVGELEIDSGTRVVRRRGREIVLTRGELAVLEGLARKAGRVVSSTVLAQRLFNDVEQAERYLIAGYIVRLRRKIDRGFDRPLILTRPGWGYLLQAE